MTTARAFRGFRFPAEVILWAVRWYLQFPISYRDLEHMLADRGVQIMCTRSSFDYDLHERSGVRPGRSLVEWLRDLWRPHRPQVQEAQETEVVPLPPGRWRRTPAKRPTTGAPKPLDPRRTNPGWVPQGLGLALW